MHTSTSTSTIIRRKRSLESTTTIRQLNNEDNERMDPARKKQCSIILKKLMHHTSVPLQKHLDLRRIERKLDCKAYQTTSRFAADVKQTLANAMQKHPSTDDEVHIKAKELNNIFNVSWQTRSKWWIDVPEPRPEKKQKVLVKLSNNKYYAYYFSFRNIHIQYV